MKYTEQDLNWAVEEGLLDGQTKERLVAAFKQRYKDRPSLTFENVLYYLGGLMVIGAMTIYVTSAWDELSGGSLLGVALLYAAIFLAIGNTLWRSGHRIPGGLLVTAAVCMTPMATYGILEMAGWPGSEHPGFYRDFYHWIESGWLPMEIATLITGVLALRYYRFPFITLPIAFALWFLSMDLVAAIHGPHFDWEDRRIVSVWFGLAMIVGTLFVDRRAKQDYAFWAYLFGVATFWGGLSLLDSDSELSRFAYCMINVAMMAVSVLLRRRVFIVFGAIGVMGYLGSLAYRVFDDELLFSVAVSLIGMVIIGMGLLYRKHEQRIEQWMLAMVSESVRSMLPGPRV